jgi:hypothetical protein
MIPMLLELLKDNKGIAVIGTALTVVLLLGGTGAVELPADRAVGELSIQLASGMQEVNEYRRQQSMQDARQDLQAIRWQIEDVNRSIINLAQDDDPTIQEYVEMLKEQRKLLMLLEQQTMGKLGAEG